jgi:hypothetical protein
MKLCFEDAFLPLHALLWILRGVISRELAICKDHSRCVFNNAETDLREVKLKMPRQGVYQRCFASVLCGHDIYRSELAIFHLPYAY